MRKETAVVLDYLAPRIGLAPKVRKEIYKKDKNK
jgi:hypothetical protein